LSNTAQNIKISSKAWELLRWAKFELNEKSYSDTILILNNTIQNRSKRLEKTLKQFDKDRHRIKTKTPADKNINPSDKKPKTILLRPDAQKILNRLKLESNISAYTYSDAIEFLIQANPNIWNEIPDRLRK